MEGGNRSEGVDRGRAARSFVRETLEEARGIISGEGREGEAVNQPRFAGRHPGGFWVKRRCKLTRGVR